MSDKTNEKSPVCIREEETLKFWQENSIFEESIERPAGLKEPKGDFVFYDGPPFATGLPHYGHILAGTIKDTIPRYKTMQGYRVRRRWGWDCHGLPVENLIEKELGLASKKDIITYGIEKFNEASRVSVMRYADEWRKLVPRFGRFVDMDDDYRTMDTTYTESVWWAFKTLHDKGLIYEGFKVMQLCPRCETTLSNFEVAQGYKDIADLSAFVRFELVDSPKTYVLAWTTTPWTLPGNVALAVGKSIEYVEASFVGMEGTYIFAKSRIEQVKVASKGDVKIIREIKGGELVGKSYKPPFAYYTKDKSIKNHANAWKIYPADFVTTEDGTGVVHIAPAFGADDYALSLAHSLPFIQHVSPDGKFKAEVTDFANTEVKPKDDHQKADIEIIKHLAHAGFLFAKEKINHSYPHCWRCDTPLLNYATSSWFVKVTDFKDDLVKANKKVSWVPKEVGEGRFGNWLEGARDWAISRSRFWGAPLPVWKDEKTGEVEVIGSIADMKSRIGRVGKKKNTYHLMRHGEAANNVERIMSATANVAHHLTEKGKRQVQTTAKKFLADGLKFDYIFVSPFVRTQETAGIVAKTLGIDKKNVITDNRIHEIKSGVFDGKSFDEYHAFFGTDDRFVKKPEGGENFTEIRRRMGEFIYDIDSKYEGKNILIVTHDTPAWLLYSLANGANNKLTGEIHGSDDHFFRNAEARVLDFAPLPHNADYALDLHRPYIDQAELTSKAGNKLVRVPEVFDCWFESGAMPFGEAHYPFDKKEFNPGEGMLAKVFGGKFAQTRGFPANFIAEGLDQTRGWFYSMLVLGVALFGKSPYENVIVNGTILAEDGEKMSKSKKNYPDPMVVVNKYGADAVRYYMLSSPVVHAQDFCFSERGVDEVVKKHIGRLNNVVTFYEMYADSHTKTLPANLHVLDQWILTRLVELSREVTRAMDAYELDRATRPFADFIDDMSTWYLRRSRDRFKSSEEKKQALATTEYVLLTLSKLLAPFMPFFAEDIYSRVKSDRDPKSVHLCAWPDLAPIAERLSSPKSIRNIIPLMAEVRNISSLGLEARSRAKVNVRQPLQSITVRQGRGSSVSEHEPLMTLIRDEVNVKAISWRIEINDAPNQVPAIDLDTEITAELREEGNVRELIRAIQDLRKKENLTITDTITLEVYTDMSGKTLLEKNLDSLKPITGISGIEFISEVPVTAEVVTIGGMPFAISIKK